MYYPEDSSLNLLQSQTLRMSPSTYGVLLEPPHTVLQLSHQPSLEGMTNVRGCGDQCLVFKLSGKLNRQSRNCMFAGRSFSVTSATPMYGCASQVQNLNLLYPTGRWTENQDGTPSRQAYSATGDMPWMSAERDLVEGIIRVSSR